MYRTVAASSTRGSFAFEPPPPRPHHPEPNEKLDMPLWIDLVSSSSPVRDRPNMMLPNRLAPSLSPFLAALPWCDSPGFETIIGRVVPPSTRTSRSPEEEEGSPISSNLSKR
jgi:hypothetical protein